RLTLLIRQDYNINGWLQRAEMTFMKPESRRLTPKSPERLKLATVELLSGQFIQLFLQTLVQQRIFLLLQTLDQLADGFTTQVNILPTRQCLVMHFGRSFNFKALFFN